MARRFDELAAKIDLLQGAPPAPPRSKLATFFHEWGPAIGLAAAMAAGGYGLNHRLDQEREDRLQLAADVRDGFKSVQGSLDKLSDQLHDLDKREAVDGKKP